MNDTPRTNEALTHRGDSFNDVVIRCERLIGVSRDLEIELADARSLVREVLMYVSPRMRLGDQSYGALENRMILFGLKNAAPQAPILSPGTPTGGPAVAAPTPKECPPKGGEGAADNAHPPSEMPWRCSQCYGSGWSHEMQESRKSWVLAACTRCNGTGLYK